MIDSEFLTMRLLPQVKTCSRKQMRIKRLVVRLPKRSKELPEHRRRKGLRMHEKMPLQSTKKKNSNVSTVSTCHPRIVRTRLMVKLGVRA